MFVLLNIRYKFFVFGYYEDFFFFKERKKGLEFLFGGYNKLL